MTYELKRTYIFLLLPAVVGFILTLVLRHFDLVHLTIVQLPMLSPLVFIASVCTAVAVPILYRTLFANKIRHQTHTSEKDWLRFERSLLHIAMVTPYLSLIAHILQLPRFHLAGTILMAFYAAYYYYPSKKRIEFDRRIFRVR